MTIDRDAPLQLPDEGGVIGRYDRELALALLRELEFRALIGRLPPLEGEDREAAAQAIAAATAGAALRGTKERVAPATVAPRATGGDELQLGFNFNSVSEGNSAAGRAAPTAAVAPSSTGEAEVALSAQIEALKRGDLAAAGALHLNSVSEGEQRFSTLSTNGVLSLGGYGVDRRGPRGPIALAIADERGALLVAEDPSVVHRLLTLIARSGRELVGLGIKDLFGALIAIGADEAPHLVDDVALGTWISNVTLRNPGLVEVAASRLGADLPEGLTPVQVATLSALVALASRAGIGGELRTAGTERLYREIELPLVEVLARMEAAGIAVDSAALAQLGDAFRLEIARLEAAAEKSVGRAVALGSPKQLGELLFGELGLSRGKKTKTGAWSTDASVLEEIQGEHPLVGIALEWRTVSKLQSTYVEALPKLVEADGRIHTTFQQAIAATGRLSSVEPNLQNIPIRSELGRKIRHAFIAEKGNRLVAADYSQIELRILAHVTRDPHLIEAFAAGEDIHRATASRVLGKPQEEVNDDERAMAKMVNFGIAYGMGDFGLATRAGISRDAAKTFIAGYFERYPGIKRYIDTIKEEARANGAVTTQLGRRRPIPELRAANPALRAAGERAAINHPIQGTAADIIKIAMIRLTPRLAAAGLKARLILQVHDELLLEAPEGEVERLIPLLIETMEGALALDVPLTVEAKTGIRWDEMQRWSGRA